MIREKIARIIKEEISKKLKESRADQLRRELDDAVNGTDYGYTPKDTGEDSTVARGRGLEVDDEPPKRQPEETLETLPPKIEYWPNGNKERVIYRNRKGEYHRTDGPAIEWFFGNGQVRSRQFYINGEYMTEREFEKATKHLNRDETAERFANLEVDEETLPPEIEYWSNGKKERVAYRNSKGQFHRIGSEPAVEEFYRNGKIKTRSFYINGKFHRTDGPAYEVFNPDGEPVQQYFYIYGREMSKEQLEKYVKNLNRDETAERFAALEVDDDPVENQTEETLPPKIEYWPNGKKKSVTYRNSKGKLHRTDGPADEVFNRDGEPALQLFYINGRGMSKEQFEKYVKHLNRDQTAERFAALEVEPPKERDLNKYPKNSKSDDEESDPRFKALELDESANRNSGILNEAAMAEKYVRQELRRIFPDIKDKVEEFYKSKKKIIKTYQYRLEFKDKNDPHVVPMYISLRPTDGISYSAGGGYGFEIEPATGDFIGVLKINILLPKIDFTNDTKLKKVLDQKWSELYKTVRTTLIHELIHKGQGDKMLGFKTSELKSMPNADYGKRTIDKQTLEEIWDLVKYLERDPVSASEKMKEMMTALPNFFSPVEIEAYAREAYMLAKKDRIDFDKAINKAADRDVRSSFVRFFQGDERKTVPFFNLLKRRIEYYAKKHLFQKAPSLSKVANSKRQQGNYRPPS